MPFGRITMQYHRIKTRHKKNQAYYGCIENMDYAVGKLMKFLTENNLDENTILLFTSDNGSIHQGSNDPLRGEKCFQYDGAFGYRLLLIGKERFRQGQNQTLLGILPMYCQPLPVSHKVR